MKTIGSSASASHSDNIVFNYVSQNPDTLYIYSMNSIDNAQIFTEKLNIHLFSCFDFRLDVDSWITPITNLVIKTLYNIKLTCYSLCHCPWKTPSASVIFMKKIHDLMQFKITVSLFPKQVQVLELLVIMMLRKFWTTHGKTPLVSALWEQGFTMHETCIYSIDDHYYSWTMSKAGKTTNMYPLLHWITSDSFKSSIK